MAGFPTRTSPNAFGPVLVNRATPRHPARDVGADRLNLMRWQCAGSAVVGPLASILIKNTAGTPSIEEQTNGWHGTGATITDQGVGHYRLTFPATVADETGALIPLDFTSATVTCENAGSFCIGTYTIVNAYTVDIKICDMAGAAADCSCRVKLD